MRCAVFGFAMMMASASPAQMTPTKPVSPAVRSVDEQVFIAPSGKPFRAPLGAPYPVATWFAEADRNHDGKISESEFTADFADFFATLDVDHDGFVRPDEIQRYEHDVAPEVQSFGGGGSRHYYENSGGRSEGSASVGKSTEIESDLKTDRPSGGGRFGLINIPEPVAGMDIDFNGSVNRNELIGAARRRFRLLDPDAKGSLALSDLPKSWAQLHPRRGKR